MGLFDFLKIDVKDKKSAATKGGRAPSAGSRIEFDGKSFPLAAITTKGFVAGRFDGSLVKGQNARLSVVVDDAFGRFSITSTVAITDVKDGNVVGEFSLLDPDTEATIRAYAQKRKASGGR